MIKFALILVWVVGGDPKIYSEGFQTLEGCLAVARNRMVTVIEKAKPLPIIPIFAGCVDLKKVEV